MVVESLEDSTRLSWFWRITNYYDWKLWALVENKNSYEDLVSVAISLSQFWAAIPLYFIIPVAHLSSPCGRLICIIWYEAVKQS